MFEFVELSMGVTVITPALYRLSSLGVRGDLCGQARLIQNGLTGAVGSAPCPLTPDSVKFEGNGEPPF